MAYSVKEIFYTLQGEGRNAGRAAVFCRFAGCNLWSGREVDRAGAVCRFCDTDFVGMDGTGGGRFGDAAALAGAVETNGTLAAPAGLDWVCVSPKAGARLVQRSGDELKLVYPQEGLEPEAFEGWDFRHFLLQPMDGPAHGRNTEAAIAYCMAHPKWRFSFQTHKAVGIR